MAHHFMIGVIVTFVLCMLRPSLAQDGQLLEASRTSAPWRPQPYVAPDSVHMLIACPGWADLSHSPTRLICARERPSAQS
jgi:hypothetical protein